MNKKITPTKTYKFTIIDNDNVYQKLDNLFKLIVLLRRLLIEDRRRIQASSDRIMGTNEQVSRYISIKDEVPINKIPYDTALSIIKDISYYHKKNLTVPNVGKFDNIKVPFYCSVSYRYDEMNIPGIGVVSIYRDKPVPKNRQVIVCNIYKKGRKWLADLVTKKKD